MIGYARITRREFYDLGGFRHSWLLRVQRARSWAYYRKIDA